MSDLKPCPFCGSKVRFNYDAELEPTGVYCGQCHALISFTRINMQNRETYGDVMSRIAEAWNRRAKDE